MISLLMTQPGRNRLLTDFAMAAKSYDLWLYLAWQDVRIKYRRSKIGPLWITLSMSIFCLALGVVYSNLFKIDVTEYLPYLSASFVVWGFISNTLNDFPNLFVDNAPYIKNMKINPLMVLLRSVARGVIIFCHNLLIIIGIYLYFGIWPGINALLALPGFFLVVLNVIAIGISLSIVGARFRDIAPITQSIIQVIFFITPIMWVPRLVPKGSWVIAANPMAYFLDLVRSPLLGNAPSHTSWIVSIITLLLMLGFAAWLYRRKSSRVAFWV